jgi:MFS family permease
MKKNNRSERKPYLTKRNLVIGIIIFIIFGVALSLLLPSFMQQPETISISRVAQGITSGQVVRIEDTMLTGEIIVHLSRWQHREWFTRYQFILAGAAKPSRRNRSTNVAGAV